MCTEYPKNQMHLASPFSKNIKDQVRLGQSHFIMVVMQMRLESETCLLPLTSFVTSINLPNLAKPQVPSI